MSTLSARSEIWSRENRVYSEIVLERAAKSCAFAVDVKSQDREQWKQPPRDRIARARTQTMDVDKSKIEKTYHDALYVED